ncbi:DUF2202 domain-containing protein [Roseospira navarrensis]|uniref:DUF2202 domain-containing protein n=1 Tax=Roseospira navarrensis TaxID=140058 RepID=A0A7X2D3Q5_9PROT|nr:DUF2202 domain-containing protein [Roseospira navarrensis]MQX37073.1 DUF2202 domain-containing protein [Roseospira navarrensis]
MPETLRRALEEALDHEYQAAATYEAAIAAFGPVPPFVEIVEAERRHADQLLCLFERHGFDPPPNRWRGHIPKPADLEDACRAATATEEAGAALYARLVDGVADAETRAVFTRLQTESMVDHRPAFAACAENRTRHLLPIR